MTLEAQLAEAKEATSDMAVRLNRALKTEAAANKIKHASEKALAEAIAQRDAARAELKTANAIGAQLCACGSVAVVAVDKTPMCKSCWGKAGPPGGLFYNGDTLTNPALRAWANPVRLPILPTIEKQLPASHVLVPKETIAAVRRAIEVAVGYVDVLVDDNRSSGHYPDVEGDLQKLHATVALLKEVE